jgi:hypothetical protein
MGAGAGNGIGGKSENAIKNEITPEVRAEKARETHIHRIH